MEQASSSTPASATSRCPTGSLIRSPSDEERSMSSFPHNGDDVQIWPMPGLQVQDGPLAVSDGGRFLCPEGRSVKWSEFHQRQFLGGEIALTDPRPQQVKE